MTDQFEESTPSLTALPLAALLPAGRQLRNAREALDLTPEQVALQLKLSVRQITAIEQEAFDELPSNLFIRGFVRNYARLVKLDAEPLLAYLAEVLPTEQAQATLLDTSITSGVALPRAVKNQRHLSPVWLMMGLGLILGVAAVFWFLQQPANPELALPEIDTPPVLDLPVASAVVEATAMPASVASSVAVAASVASAIVSSSPAAETASSIAAVSSDAIKVTSSTDSWVQIIDANGNKVLSEIIRPGIERTVDGKPPFAVKVGNAPKTTVYFHGQNVDLSAYLKPGSDVVNLELK
ncbi:RodZ domain-containing protein [Deefgea rivuli]|uniref:RodZ domain-containing protein n=1 Tax=Deefgea rivuli TaxID=400948 RepID=UPI000483C102|nr:RodZ domain-containing protein [Deefgea rivuli]